MLESSAPAVSLRDLFPARQAATDPLEVRVVSERLRRRTRRRLLLREVRFDSHEWQQGTVRIAAFVAVPLGLGPVPAMVVGAGDLKRAADFAARHQIGCLCFDRPGTGASTGPADEYANWIHFDHPREGWMWHYVYAALRALTYLQSLPEVDPTRLGITGYSRGDTMAYIANGVDPRICVSVPQASAGGILGAVDVGGWAASLHRDAAGRPYVPEAFYEFARYYDPALYADMQNGLVMPIIGAQDEFFPLETVAGTVRAMSPRCRLELIANWDHAYFAGGNADVDAFDNRRAFRTRTRRWLAAATRCLREGGNTIPPMPVLQVDERGQELHWEITAAHHEDMVRGRLWYSTDGAYTFAATRAVRCAAGFVTRLRLSRDVAAGLAAFAEVEYRQGPLISSLPYLGPAFCQRLRPFPEQ